MATALLAPLALQRHFAEPVVSAARTCVVAAAAPMPRRGERGSSPCSARECRCSVAEVVRLRSELLRLRLLLVAGEARFVHFGPDTRYDQAGPARSRYSPAVGPVAPDQEN